jgi:hypothetical protein
LGLMSRQIWGALLRWSALTLTVLGWTALCSSALGAGLGECRDQDQSAALLSEERPGVGQWLSQQRHPERALICHSLGWDCSALSEPETPLSPACLEGDTDCAQSREPGDAPTESFDAALFPEDPSPNPAAWLGLACWDDPDLCSSLPTKPTLELHHPLTPPLARASGLVARALGWTRRALDNQHAGLGPCKGSRALPERPPRA